MRLFTRLLNGDWDGDDFLVLKPGQRVAAKYDGSIVAAEEAP